MSKNKIFEIIFQVSGSGSWAKVIAGNLRTYNPPALPQDLCSQVSRIVEVIFFVTQMLKFLVPGIAEVIHDKSVRFIITKVYLNNFG